MSAHVFGGFQFDAGEVERVAPKVALDLARAVRHEFPTHAGWRALDRLSVDLAARANDRRQWCRTPEVWALRELVEWKIAAGHWPGEVRLQVQRVLSGADRELERYQVMRPHFRVEYQLGAGCTPDPGEVPLEIVEPGSDPPVVRDILLPDGRPAFVRRLVYWLESALDVYTRPPFSIAAPGEPVIVSIDCTAGNTNEGSAALRYIYLFVAPNCAEDLLCSLASHELFHIFQGLAGGSPNGSWGSLIEGGAVWAEDAVANALNRYLYEAGRNVASERGVLVEPNQPLDRCEYKSALLWRYIVEQAAPDLAHPFGGVSAYLELLQRCARGNDIEDVIRDLFPGRVFARFLRLPDDEEPIISDAIFGNYALACRLKDLGSDVSDARFDFEESRGTIHADYLYPPDEPVQRTLASLAPRTAVLTPGGPPVRFDSDALPIEPWAHQFFDILVEPGVASAEIHFLARNGFAAPLVQIALIDDAGGIVDILRSDAAAFTRSVAVERPSRRRVARLAIVVSATAEGGRFRVEVAVVPACPDVMVTRWNAALATEYEADPRAAPWMWTSPDLQVWPSDGAPNRTVVPGFANSLFIGLHNRGPASAAGIAIALSFQESRVDGRGIPVLAAAAWRTALSAPGVPARLDNLSLGPGQSNRWTVGWDPSVNWTPGVGKGSERLLCVRAMVSAPGDRNLDNKRALSMFGCRVTEARSMGQP